MLEKIGGLASERERLKPVTVVVDAGIASEANLRWFQDNGYCYLVVSRQRHREFDEQGAILVKNHDGLQVRAQKIVDHSTGEVRLYSHSSALEAKERAIDQSLADRLERSIHLSAGLSFCSLHPLSRLKAYGINDGWTAIRRRSSTQLRVTAQLKCADGRALHNRKSTQPDPYQQSLYDALNVPALPGRVAKSIA